MVVAFLFVSGWSVVMLITSSSDSSRILVKFSRVNGILRSASPVAEKSLGFKPSGVIFLIFLD